MSGISRNLQPDPKHIAKHLPDTPQMQKLLREEGSAHVFNDEETLQTVAETIIEQGEFIGTIRGHDRYGLYFPQSIGYTRCSSFLNSSLETRYFQGSPQDLDPSKLITALLPRPANKLRANGGKSLQDYNTQS